MLRERAGRARGPTSGRFPWQSRGRTGKLALRLTREQRKQNLSFHHGLSPPVQKGFQATAGPLVAGRGVGGRVWPEGRLGSRPAEGDEHGPEGRGAWRGLPAGRKQAEGRGRR